MKSRVFLRMDTIGVNYRRVECKSLLNKSGLSDYAVNCYTGCSHACVYCYARFVTRFTHPHEDWGAFVDIKENAPEVLAKEVKRKAAGHVMLSSVCDAWQPVEESTLLTRRCLELLTQYRFSVSALTKNALAARDLDLLKQGGGELGVTVTTLDAGLARLIEPGASPPEKRLEVLEAGKSKGIKTYAFLGPLMPFLSDTEDNITGLLKAVNDAGVDYFYVDKLNLRYGVWLALLKLLKEHYPALLPEYRKIFFEQQAKEAYKDHLSQRIHDIAGRLGMSGKMNCII
jgi:DNA repair photolyase